MPSDSKTTDPRPAATEAAVSDDSVLGEVAQIIDEAIDRHLHVSDDVELPGNDIVDDIIHAGFVIVRLNAAAAPPSGRAACPTCGETGVDHDGFVCRDCDGQGSTPIAVPPSGQVCVSVEDLDYAIGDWNANKNLTERGEAIRDRLRAALKGASE